MVRAALEPLNRLVVGSNPARPTFDLLDFSA